MISMSKFFPGGGEMLEWKTALILSSLLITKLLHRLPSCRMILWVSGTLRNVKGAKLLAKADEENQRNQKKPKKPKIQKNQLF